MKLISPDLENELVSQEQKPFSVRGARVALETALEYQFAIVADGILAWLLLHDQRITETTWRALHRAALNRKSAWAGFRSETVHTDLITFQKGFLHQIARRAVKPIDPRRLRELEVRIYGRQVRIYDESEINRQLAKLGSAFRIAIPGVRTIIVNDVIHTIGLEIEAHRIDGRFIFGQVSQVTAMPYAQLLDFEKEVAVSPLMDPGGAGFTYDDKIVLRQSVLTGINISQSHQSTKINKDLLRIRTLIHESVHVFGSSGRSWSNQVSRRRHPYAPIFWLLDSKRDICRFTETPRTLEEVRAAFEWNFENFLLKSQDLPKLFLGVDLSKMVSHFTLAQVLKQMEEDGLVVNGVDGVSYSPIFEDGREWCL